MVAESSVCPGLILDHCVPSQVFDERFEQMRRLKQEGQVCLLPAGDYVSGPRPLACGLACAGSRASTGSLSPEARAAKEGALKRRDAPKYTPSMDEQRSYGLAVKARAEAVPAATERMRSAGQSDAAMRANLRASGDGTWARHAKGKEAVGPKKAAHSSLWSLWG